MSKNIEMQELTSNRYETLYPKTAIDLVEGYQEDWKIGDCRLTLKKDLRENWHLCDGTQFSADEYPDLRNMLGVDVTTQWNEKKEIVNPALTTNTVSIRKAMISNGKYFFWCSNGLYFSDVPDGSYQKISFFSGKGKVYEISYLAPYWYALVNENNKYKIYKTTTLTGSWSALNFSLDTATVYNGYYVYMTSVNGEIVLYGGQDGQYNKRNLLWIKDSNDNFNELEMTIFSQRQIQSLFYANRFYYMDSSGTGGPVYSTSLTGGWTLVNGLKRGNLYYDGESVWGINNNDKVVRIINPTSKVVYSGVSSIGGVVRLSDGYGILNHHTNGKFSLYLAKDQSTSFKLGQECTVIYSQNSDYWGFSYNFQYSEKNGVIYIMQSIGTTYYDTPRKYGYSFYVYSIGGCLPNIKIAGANVYIKMRD